MPRFTSSWHVFWGRVRLFFGIWLFLVRLTPAIANLVEFLGKRVGELVIGISGATGNHSSQNFGQFWVFSAFWSQWSRLQSQQRCRSAIFRIEELEEPSGPWVKRSFIGAAFTVLCDFRVISSSVCTQILCLQQVWPFYWPFYHCNTILSINRARTCPLGALDPADVAQEGWTASTNAVCLWWISLCCVRQISNIDLENKYFSLTQRD